MIRLYDIPDNTFESEDEEPDDDENGKLDVVSLINGVTCSS